MLYDLEQLSTEALVVFEAATHHDLCGPAIASANLSPIHELFSEGLAFEPVASPSGFSADLTAEGVAALHDWMPLPLPASIVARAEQPDPPILANDNDVRRAAA